MGLLCGLYAAGLLAVLPLYTGQGYWQLGNTKYTLFRNLSLLCLGCWAGAEICGFFGNVLERRRLTFRRPAFCGLDWAVAIYALLSLLSAGLSSYGPLAWKGYEGWFMGAFSQLLLAGIYFFASRRYDGAAWPLYAGEAALFLTTAFGLLHRLGVDPLGLMEGWNSGDWEYSHMLSTLGNINWLCGYYSVALSLPVVHCLRGEKFWGRALSYVVSVSAFLLLGVQGSQGGLLILAVCAVVCMALGRGKPVLLKRLWRLLAGFFFCMPVMWLLMGLRGKNAAVVADGNVFEHVEWYVWTLLGAVCAAFALYYSQGEYYSLWEKLGLRRPMNRVGKMLSGWKRKAAAGSLALICCACICVFGLRSMDDSFGSGRGFLWRISVQGFAEADWKDKLLGAGPDCYGEAVFNRLGAGTEVWKGEHWEGAVFTNAHNEFLSQLINVGLLGTAAYLGIFAMGLGRFVRRGCWLPVLALLMYGAHALISFQQVLNAPLLFLVLGICRADGFAEGPAALGEWKNTSLPQERERDQEKAKKRTGEENHEMDEV